MATRSGLLAIRQIAKHWTQEVKGFENILSKIKVVAGGGGTCRCEITLQEEHQNRGGVMHGAMTSLLVDSVSTWALLGSDEPVAGVSVNLDVSFCKPARVGDVIVVDAHTQRRGRRLAFMSVDIINKADGKLLAQGKLTKFIGQYQN